MQPSNHNMQVDAKNLSIEHLNKILTLKNLPTDIAQMLLETKNKIEAYDLTSTKPALTKLNGDLLTVNEILNILNTISEDWKLVSTKDTFDTSDLMNAGFGVHPQWYAEHYNLDIAMDETKIYEFSKKNYNYAQGDIHRIVVQCLPGHVDVSFDTGSVGYSLEKIITNAQLKKQLKSHI